MAGVVGVLVLAAGLARADDEKEKPRPGAGLRNPEALFKKLDANGDGKVTKEEFTKFFEQVAAGRLKDRPQLIEKLFEKLDANGDGSLTLDEFKKIKELREQFGGRNKKEEK